MNKVVNINLGGFPFTMDDSAYDLLSQYLMTLKKHFSKSEGCDEIMSDIEARLAELLQEQLGARTIVTTKEIEAAITVMGRPEDFGAAAMDENPSAKSSTGNTFTTGKKLFRDESNKVVGGVCSGIAAYFGIPDALWVRLAFVAVFFAFGFGIALYIVLLVIIPKAETSADYLAMKGEPINVPNIAKTIEAEIQRLSNKISGYSDSSDDKKKETGNFDQTRHAIESGISALGGALDYAIHFFTKIFKPFLYLIGGLLVLGLSAAFIAATYAFMNSKPIMNSIFQSNGHAYLGLINLTVLIGVPLLSIIFTIFQVFRRTKIKSYVWASMWSFWSINLISAIFLGVSIGHQFSNDYFSKSSTQLINKDSIVVSSEDLMNGLNVSMFDIKYDKSNGNVFSDDINLNIEKADGDQFQLIQERYSKGASSEEAANIAKSIQWNYTLKSNQLTLPNAFVIQNGQKYRDQGINVTLKVPVGKYVVFKEDMNGIVRNVFLNEEEESPDDYEGNTWQMTANGLICPSFLKANKFEKILDFKDFKHLQLDGQLDVEIQRGDKFEIKAIGKESLIEKDLKAVPTNSMLMISFNNEDSEAKLKLLITLPEIEKITLEDLKSFEIKGFSQKKMEIAATGDFEITAKMEVEELTMDLEETTAVLFGLGNTLDVKMASNAKLNAFKYKLKSAKVDNRDDCEIKLDVSDTVDLDGSEDNLEIKGDATVKNKKKKDEE